MAPLSNVKEGRSHFCIIFEYLCVQTRFVKRFGRVTIILNSNKANNKAGSKIKKV